MTVDTTDTKHHTGNDVMDNTASAELDDVSRDAWQAYNAMFESKQSHYEFLEVLENKKKKFNISPSEQDKLKLAQFLTLHDEQVKKFTRLSIDLKATSPESHANLFRFIGQLGDGVPREKTPH